MITSIIAGMVTFGHLRQLGAVARQIGATGLILLRADSAYYTGKVIAAARRAGARFSITVPSNPGVRNAIATISEKAWTSIRYPDAIWDNKGQDEQA